MKRFEYKQVRVPNITVETLDREGLEGWELVTSHEGASKEPAHYSVKMEGTSYYAYFLLTFKRERYQTGADHHRGVD